MNAKTRNARITLGLIAVGIFLLGYRACDPTPIDRTVFWKDSVIAEDSDVFSMVAVRETGYVGRPFSWHRMARENQDVIERVEVWLGRWRIEDPEHPLSADKVCTLARAPATQRLFRVIGGPGVDAVLIREHGIVSGRVVLSVWHRRAGGFEKTAERTVDDFLGASQANTALVARDGGRVVVVTTRTLEDQAPESPSLNALLEGVEGWPRVRVTDDGRYVFRFRGNYTETPLKIEGVDLSKNSPISWTFPSKTGSARLFHVLSVDGKLHLLIGHGSDEWTYEVVDAEGRTLRTLSLKAPLDESSWDVRGGRFFVPVNHYQLPSSTLDVVSEDGASRRIVPRPPPGLPESVRP